MAAPNLDLRRRANAWKQFFANFGGTFAVTLAYNPFFGGTASPCFRLTGDGEVIPLPTAGVPVVPGTNRLPAQRRIPLEQVHSDLYHLHHDVDRQLFGKRFNKLSEARRSSFVGYVEHAETNMHVHLLWRVREDRREEFADVVGLQWKAISRFHSIDVQAIYSDGWSSYVLKDQVGFALEGDPALFVYSRTARP